MLIGDEEERVPSCFIGIDPGVNGGFAILGANVEVEAFAMPDTELAVWQWFNDVAYWHGANCFACIEQVGGWVGSHQRKEGDDGSESNPGSAMFTFGQSYGSLRMALVATGIPFEAVRPQAWQKVIGVKRNGEDTTRWKNVLKAKAQQLFPSLKVTKATADALLIAAYCRIKWGGIVCQS